MILIPCDRRQRYSARTATANSTLSYDTKTGRQRAPHHRISGLNASRETERSSMKAGLSSRLYPGPKRAVRSGSASGRLERAPKRYAKGATWIRNEIFRPPEPGGLGVPREIITVRLRRRSRNITGFAGRHERSPAWSPTGSLSLIFPMNPENTSSCPSQDGKGAAPVPSGRRRILCKSGLVADSRKIAYRDNSSSLYWIDSKPPHPKKSPSAFS